MNDRARLPIHGGDLHAIGRAFGIDPSALLDFSANVNPLGPPRSLVRALAAGAARPSALTRYPEPTYETLRSALAKTHGVDPEGIVVGNGGAALFEAALAALDVRRALVPVPAFSEYARAIAARGARLVAAPLDRSRDFEHDARDLADRARANACDTVVLNTPHNPTGGVVAREVVCELAETLARERRRLVVDEAFVDYVESESAIREAARARTHALVVVRSLTKFYAVPALRVGFAIASPELAAAMRAAMPSWPVTTLAADALVAALDDLAYARRSRDENAAARERLRSDLERIGLRALPSAASYVLVELPPGKAAATVVERLIARHGIVVRDCTTYAGLEDGRYIRVAVRGASDDARLVAALRDVLGAGEPPYGCDSKSSVRASGTRCNSGTVAPL